MPTMNRTATTPEATAAATAAVSVKGARPGQPTSSATAVAATAPAVTGTYAGTGFDMPKRARPLTT